MASEDGVRATNDDAAQCKRHAVDKGYWKDPYLSLICPKGQPKLPEISIGYYARVKGMRTLLDKFLKLTSCACQVVNLGAGFDTTYWNLKDLRLAPRNFVEVDFSGITSKKVTFIKRWKPLLEKVTSEDGEIQVSSTELHSQDYHLVAADLTQLSELEKKLKDSGIDKNIPTVFIAECVLVYIEPRKSEELLKWIVDNFSTAFFINYEQVNMIDRFGDIMLENLRARQCTLHVEACKSLESQIKRAGQYLMVSVPVQQGRKTIRKEYGAVVLQVQEDDIEVRYLRQKDGKYYFPDTEDDAWIVHADIVGHLDIAQMASRVFH